MKRISDPVDAVYGIYWEPVFIQIGSYAVPVHQITGVYFQISGSILVETVAERTEFIFRGPAADAFRTWWKTKASVDVLYTEPDDGSST